MADWKNMVLEARQRELAEESDLIAGAFRLRLHSLIGLEVNRSDVQVAAPQARATVDGVTFLLDGMDFYIEHGCPNCLEALTTEPLLTAADVGRALTDWLPNVGEQCPHKGLEPTDPGERLLRALRDLVLECL